MVWIKLVLWSFNRFCKLFLLYVDFIIGISFCLLDRYLIFVKKCGFRLRNLVNFMFNDGVVSDVILFLIGVILGIVILVFFGFDLFVVIVVRILESEGFVIMWMIGNMNFW